jgi:hypothetical protein
MLFEANKQAKYRSRSLTHRKLSGSDKFEDQVLAYKDLGRNSAPGKEGLRQLKKQDGGSC